MPISNYCDFSRYQVILNKRPFGSAPMGTIKPILSALTSIPKKAFINDLRMCAITEDESSLHVGIINTKSNKHYFIGIGESADGITLVDANFDASSATLRKGAEEYRMHINTAEIVAITGATPGAAPNEGPEKAYDKDPHTKYCTESPAMSITVQFSKPLKAYQYTITSANDERRRDPSEWTLYGSNDGKTWQVLDKQKLHSFRHRLEKHSFTITKQKSCTFYKLKVSKNHGGKLHQIADFNLV